VSNYIIIVNNVVIKLFLDLKKYWISHVGEDVLKNLKMLLKDLWKLKLQKLKKWLLY